MEVLLLLAGGGFAAGVFGSLLGLGGGILIVPLLTLGFGLPLREAVGTSLLCVIVTSSAAAGVFLERRQANLRLGMSLELFTATGALAGGLIAFLLSDRVLAGLFAALLAYTAVAMVGRARDDRAATGLAEATGDPEPGLEDRSMPLGKVGLAALSGEGYVVRRLGIGIVGSLFAGVVSALLGVGGGIVKVPLMHLVMGVPLRVATATSNLMIGVTASASAIVYLLRGGIDPYVTSPTALGVFLGASLGSRVGHRLPVQVLRVLFVAVLAVTAWQMAGRALQ